MTKQGTNSGKLDSTIAVTICKDEKLQQRYRTGKESLSLDSCEERYINGLTCITKLYPNDDC